MVGGRFDRLVTFQRADAAADDYTSADAAAWGVFLADVPASYRPAPGTERFQSGAIAADAPAVFEIRWSPLVADVERTPTAFRLLDENGVVFDIKSVFEIGRRDRLEIAAVRSAG